MASPDSLPRRPLQKYGHQFGNSKKVGITNSGRRPNGTRVPGATQNQTTNLSVVPPLRDHTLSPRLVEAGQGRGGTWSEWSESSQSRSSRVPVKTGPLRPLDWGRRDGRRSLPVRRTSSTSTSSSLLCFPRVSVPNNNKSDRGPTSSSTPEPKSLTPQSTLPSLPKATPKRVSENSGVRTQKESTLDPPPTYSRLDRLPLHTDRTRTPGPDVSVPFFPQTSLCGGV